MSRRKFLLGSLGAGLTASSLVDAQSPASRQTSSNKADRILLGRVRPMTSPGALAEALAIRGGRILAVGSRDEVMQFKDSSTIVNDLGSAAIIPGFNDSHAHLEREGLKTLRPSISGAHSIAEVLARISEIAHSTPAGQWIHTMPVGEPPNYFGGPAALAEKRMPTRDELDKAAPDNPVCIGAPFGFWGNPPTYTALNSLALKLNGIDRSTKPVSVDAEILHDQNGEPTGVIVNKSSKPVVDFELLPAIPRFTTENRIEGLRRSVAAYHAKGTTSTFEGHGEAPESISAYRSLWERGELTMRVGFCVSPSWSALAEAERAMRDWLCYARGRGFGDPMLRISGIEIAMGGDLKLSELARRQLPDTGWSGQVEQAYTPSDFEELCMMAARYDLRVHIVGGGRPEVLKVLDRVNQKYPLADRRWVVQHVSGVPIEDLQTIKRLGLAATLIPAGTLWKGGARAVQAEDSVQNLMAPARQLIDLGVPVSAGTDNIPYDCLFTLWTMTNRQERTTGKILGAASRLTNEEALRLMTTAGPYLTFEEHVKGPLKPGSYADLAVFSGDPISTPATDLRQLSCEATIVGGKTVHGNL